MKRQLKISDHGSYTGTEKEKNGQFKSDSHAATLGLDSVSHYHTCHMSFNQQLWCNNIKGLHSRVLHRPPFWQRLCNTIVCVFQSQTENIWWGETPLIVSENHLFHFFLLAICEQIVTWCGKLDFLSLFLLPTRVLGLCIRPLLCFSVKTVSLLWLAVHANSDSFGNLIAIWF